MSDKDEVIEDEQREMRQESRLMWMFGPEVTARPWSGIAGFFRGIVDGGGEWARPMLTLVEQIGASPYADRLFAITSMHTVIVAAAAPFHMSTEVLRIDHDHVRGDFALEFVEQPYATTCWSKRSSPDQALGAVLHLARMKGWIPPERKADDG
jgi:hypothetical protein